MVLKPKNGQEWPRMDTPLIPVTIPDPYAPPQKQWHADYLWFSWFLASQASQAKKFRQKSYITNIWKVIFSFAQWIFALELVP